MQPEHLPPFNTAIEAGCQRGEGAGGWAWGARPEDGDRPPGDRGAWRADGRMSRSGMQSVVCWCSKPERAGRDKLGNLDKNLLLTRV